MVPVAKAKRFFEICDAELDFDYPLGVSSSERDEGLAALFSDMANFEALIRERDDSQELRAWALEHLNRLRAANRRTRSTKARPESKSSSESADNPDWEALVSALGNLEPGHNDPVGDALGALMNLTGAKRGFIAALRADESLRFLAARAFSTLDVKSPEAQISHSILHAALAGIPETLTLDDASADERFEGRESVDRLALRSVLVQPLRSGGRVVAVLYLDNPDDPACFTEPKRRIVEAFARAAGPRVAHLGSEYSRLERSRARWAKLQDELPLGDFIARSPSLVDNVATVSSQRHSKQLVLISGPPGVGKRRLAEILLAGRGIRADDLRVADAENEANDSGALSQLLAENARAGLLLTNVDRLDSDQQRVLARLLSLASEEAQIVCTSSDANALVSPLFRLFESVHIAMTPLCERPEDIEALTESILKRLAAGGIPKRIQPSALAGMFVHRWPSNASELIRVLENAAACDHLHLRRSDLQLMVGGSEEAERHLKSAVRSFRRRYVEHIWSACRGDAGEAAKRLGVNKKYVYQLIKDLELT